MKSRLETEKPDEFWGSYSSQELLNDCTTGKLHTRHTFITKGLDCKWTQASQWGVKRHSFSLVVFPFKLYYSFFLLLKINSRCVLKITHSHTALRGLNEQPPVCLMCQRESLMFPLRPLPRGIEPVY